jgi:NADPH:quinone reductase-like Zn-dependent oxidoreductase
VRVNGATGAAGQLVVQIAKRLGSAKVIAMVRASSASQRMKWRRCWPIHEWRLNLN